MKLNKAILSIAAFAVALMMSLPAFAAKGDRRKTRAKDDSPTFAALDKDANGSLSKAEYVAGMKAKLGEEAATASSASSSSTAAAGMKDKLGEEAATKRFAELDKNKDDSLSKDELGTTEAKKKRDKKRKKDTN